jgi:hypothetical protein
MLIDVLVSLLCCASFSFGERTNIRPVLIVYKKIKQKIN